MSTILREIDNKQSITCNKPGSLAAVCTKFVSATKRHFGARRYARNRLVWLGDANRRLALGIPSLVGMHEMTWSSLRPSVKFMKLSVSTPQFYVNFSVNLFRSNVFLSSCLSLPLDDKMDDSDPSFVCVRVDKMEGNRVMLCSVLRCLDLPIFLDRQII